MTDKLYFILYTGAVFPLIEIFATEVRIGAVLGDMPIQNYIQCALSEVPSTSLPARLLLSRHSDQNAGGADRRFLPSQ